MKNMLTDAIIVDVRTPDEYRQGHFPNAVNIPLDQVGARAAETGPALRNKNEEIDYERPDLPQ